MKKGLTTAMVAEAVKKIEDSRHCVYCGKKKPKNGFYLMLKGRVIGELCRGCGKK